MRKEVTFTLTRVFSGLDEDDYQDQVDSFVSHLEMLGCDVVVEDEDDLEDDLTETIYDEAGIYDEYGTLTQMDLPSDVDE